MVLTKDKQRQLRQVFNAFDLNHTGSVDQSEFLELGRARRAGNTLRRGPGVATGKWTESKNERLMARVDTNKDGRIQWQEFYIYFSEVWHGGMELFENADFSATIVHLMEVAAQAGYTQKDEPKPKPKTGFDRGAVLKDVFGKFDIDSSGFIGSDELLALGKARRSSGQKGGDWTEAQNRRLLSRIANDNGASGNISEKEFCQFFLDTLPTNKSEFETEINQFYEVARIVSKGWSASKSPARAKSPGSSRDAVTTRVPRKASPSKDRFNDRYERYSSPSKASPSPSKKEPREVTERRRKRRTPLREIFSLIDLSRSGSIAVPELSQLGPAVRKLTSQADGELVAESDFMDGLEQSLPANQEDFDDVTSQMLEVAKEIRATKEAARKESRVDALTCVFAALDVDMRGFVTKEEILELGSVAIPNYLRRGDWTGSKSRGFIERADPLVPGRFNQDEFVLGLEKTMTLAEGGFTSNLEDFMAATSAIQNNREKDRAYQLSKMDPIERAVYEAEDAVRRARQEQSIAQQGEGVSSRKRRATADDTRQAQSTEDGASKTYALASAERQDSEAEHRTALAAKAYAEEQLNLAVTNVKDAKDAQSLCATSENEASDKSSKAEEQLSAAERAALAATENHEKMNRAEARCLDEVTELERLLALAREKLAQATSDTAHAANEATTKKAIVEAAKLHRSKAADSLEVARGLLREAKIVTANRQEEEAAVEVSVRKEMKSYSEAIAAYEAKQRAEKDAAEALERARNGRLAAMETEAEAQATLEDAKLLVLTKGSWLQVRLKEELAANGWWDAHKGRVAAETAHVSASKLEDTARQAQLRSDWAGNVKSISTFGIDSERTHDLSDKAQSKLDESVTSRATAVELDREAKRLAAIAASLTQEAENAKALCSAADAAKSESKAALLAQLELEREKERLAKLRAQELADAQAEDKRRQEEREAMALKKAEMAAKAAAESQAKREADKLAQQQADKLAQQQADKLAQQQADKLAQQQADKLAQQQADKLAQQQADKLAQQQADSKAAQERQRAAQKAEADAQQAQQAQHEKLKRQQDAKAAALVAAASKSKESGRVQQMQHVFKMFDQDRNRKVDKDEFFRVVRIFEGDYFTDKMAQFVFTKIDVNKNGFIDETEFIEFIRDKTRTISDAKFNRMISDMTQAAKAVQNEKAEAKKAQKQAQEELANMWTKQADRTREIQAAFKAMDADRDRTVNVSEFFEVGKLVHGAANSSWTMEKCQKIFDRIDTDNDGSIDESEFTVFLKDITKSKSDQQFNAMIASYKMMGERASSSSKPSSPAPAAVVDNDLAGLLVQQILDAINLQGLDSTADSIKRSAGRAGLWDDFGDWYSQKLKKSENGNQYAKLSEQDITEKAVQYLGLSRAEPCIEELRKMLKKSNTPRSTKHNPDTKSDDSNQEEDNPKSGFFNKKDEKTQPAEDKPKSGFFNKKDEKTQPAEDKPKSGFFNKTSAGKGQDNPNPKPAGGKGGPAAGGPKLSAEQRDKLKAPDSPRPAAPAGFSPADLQSVKLKKTSPKPNPKPTPAPEPKETKDEAPVGQVNEVRYTEDMAARDAERLAQEKQEMQAELDAMKAKQQADLLDGADDSAAKNKRDAMKQLSDEELVAQSLGISLQEYRVTYLGLAAEEEAPQELTVGAQKFKELDRDGKGYLVTEDLNALAKWLYEAFSAGATLAAKDVAREAKKLCEKLDTDQDGKVQMAEFVPFYEKRKEQADKAAQRRAAKRGA
eukprot:TRINITY_DN4612_c0_g1_i1.p1 TRINITY_DN4612_c0_g1~~TRINITY_DN4612_c0_g1_i1.p1  ORF type:complete len:1744 (+),score=612.88 TRINITY_DN4612_c0_g1_i1:27-5258(+)